MNADRDDHTQQSQKTKDKYHSYHLYVEPKV